MAALPVALACIYAPVAACATCAWLANEAHGPAKTTAVIKTPDLVTLSSIHCQVSAAKVLNHTLAVTN